MLTISKNKKTCELVEDSQVFLIKIELIYRSVIDFCITLENDCNST